MSVKVRLSMVGKRKQRSFRIVAIDSRNSRDGKFLENLGWYNPRTHEMQLNEEGIMKWKENGAILSNRVKKLLKVWRETEKEVSNEGTDNLHS